MSTDTLHPLPRRADVAREQFLVTGMALRAGARWIVGLMLLFSALILYTWYETTQQSNGSMNLETSPDAFGPAAILAILIPLAVWRSEEPARRTYLWSMPVERDWHQLAKNASGWAWLMFAVAAYLLWVVALALITGSEIGVGRETVFLGESFRNAQPGDWLRIRVEMAGWQWAVPFVAATATYLLGSAAALGSNHPWRWIAGGVVGFLVLGAVTEGIAELQSVNDFWESIVTGRYGLGTLFTGQVGAPEVFTSRTGRTISAMVRRPDLLAWLVSALIWLGLGVAATLAAGTRHREP